jgi:hypothetical protein
LAAVRYIWEVVRQRGDFVETVVLGSGYADIRSRRAEVHVVFVVLLCEDMTMHAALYKEDATTSTDENAGVGRNVG